MYFISSEPSIILIKGVVDPSLPAISVSFSHFSEPSLVATEFSRMAPFSFVAPIKVDVSVRK